MISALLDLVTGRALAAPDAIKLKLPDDLIGTNVDNFDSFAATVIGLIFAFLAAMAFGGILYSAVMMITAGGDAAKFAAGRKNLLWSIIGIIIVVLSYFIVIFIAKLAEGVIK